MKSCRSCKYCMVETPVGVICAVECPAVRVIGFDACERYEPTEEEEE